MASFVRKIINFFTGKKEPKEITIETPAGNVKCTTENVKNFIQQVKPLTPEDMAEINAFATRGPEFVAAQFPNLENPGLVDYDKAFCQWQRAVIKGHSPDEVIQILGAVLGNAMVAEYDMEWVVITDEYGTDFAVRGTGEAEVVSFPFSSVYKRIADNKYDFMNGIFYSVKQAFEQN